MGQLLSNLANGSLVKLGENTKPTKFIKLDNDHYGTGTGVTLIRKDTFSNIAWNASRDLIVSARYLNCTMDSFCDGIWPQMLDEQIRSCLIPAPIIVTESSFTSTLHTIYRKGFALSCTEAGVSGWQTEGKAFSYFSSDARRIAYVDETASTSYWALRSIDENTSYSSSCGVYRITSDGTVNIYYQAAAAVWAPRPAFQLKSSIVVSDSTDSDGCYTIESVPGNDGGLYVKSNGLWVKAV